MTVAWTFIPVDVQTEGDYILPRYDTEGTAREQARAEAKRSGRTQQLCKVVVTEIHAGREVSHQTTRQPS